PPRPLTRLLCAVPPRARGGGGGGRAGARPGGVVPAAGLRPPPPRRGEASIRPRLAGIRANAVLGSRLVIRTAALLLTLLTATAIAARISDDAVAAHLVAMQIFLFLALSLDALAIAAQAMVGRYLGADSAHDSPP